VTKIETLESQVAKLSPEELKAFRRWFAEFDADLWDSEIENDARVGKLDRMADQALAAHKRGEGRDI
jgi:hypothetical protein